MAIVICVVIALAAVCGVVYVTWNSFAARKSYEQLASDNVFEDVTAAPDKETQEGLSGLLLLRHDKGQRHLFHLF